MNDVCAIQEVNGADEIIYNYQYMVHLKIFWLKIAKHEAEISVVVVHNHKYEPSVICLLLNYDIMKTGDKELCFLFIAKLS